VRYLNEARALWKTYVPKIGQADTVQGELVRAVEKLRDEALRNGNVNWSKGHVIVAEFVRDTLIGSGLFDESSVNEIRRDINGLLADYDYPGTTDEPYDRLLDHVVEWSLAHPDPVPLKRNPKLRI